MGFFLFDLFKSSSKAADATVDIAQKMTGGLVSGIDKMFYTQEEKAIASKAAFDSYLPVYLELQKTLASESSLSSITRRILAFMIMGPFVGMITAAGFIYKYDPEWAKFIMTGPVESLAFLAGGVGLTYFMYYGVTKIFSSSKKEG
jgi:hypothetical protein